MSEKKHIEGCNCPWCYNEVLVIDKIKSTQEIDGELVPLEYTLKCNACGEYAGTINYGTFEW